MSYYALDAAAIGDRIRTLRKDLNSTQYAFADKLYISPSYLALIEAGKRFPTLEILAQVSKLCHVSIDFLLFGTETSDFDPLQHRLHTLTERYSPEKIEKALRLAEFYLELEASER